MDAADLAVHGADVAGEGALMNRDFVIGVVGATLLVTAMVGVFAYERSVAEAAGVGSRDGTQNLGPKSPTVAPLVGSVAVGASDPKTLAMPWTSAANVTFQLTWTATNGKDTLKLTLVAPTGSNITEGLTSETNDSGTITLKPKLPMGANATGEWKVTVDFVRATPAALPGGVPPPTPPPNSTDATVAYKVEVTLS